MAPRRRLSAFNEGRGANPGRTDPSALGPADWNTFGAFNEGRGANPGRTRYVPSASMKVVLRCVQ